MNKRHLKLALLLASVSLIGACSSDDDNDDGTNMNVSPGDNPNTTPDPDTTLDPNTTPNPPIAGTGSISYGYAFTRSPDFQSSQLIRISLTDGNTLNGTYPAPDAGSNFVVTSDDKSVYQIGRADNNITKFSASDTSLVDYQLSVLTEGNLSSNPESLVFVNDDLAYLTQRLSDSILVVDPTPEPATTESLITSEISLAAYTRTSGETIDLPDMSNAVLVEDKLFVLMQNLEIPEGGQFGVPSLPGYIAVIDTLTNQEIPTSLGVLPLPGIELNTVNPKALHYNEDTRLLYVVGQGNFFQSDAVEGDAYTGGIESIDPVTFETNLLIDDGTSSDNLGFFVNGLVVSETWGYVITLEGSFSDGTNTNKLRTFNTASGEVSDSVPGTEQYSDFTTLALGPDNHLWVGVQADQPGFLRIDIETGEVVGELVATNLVPSNIVFLEVEQQ